MSSTLKTPPVLEHRHYVEWKNDLKIWQSYIDLNKARLGTTVYLLLDMLETALVI